jgi:hypothetical protein
MQQLSFSSPNLENFTFINLQIWWMLNIISDHRLKLYKHKCLLKLVLTNKTLPTVVIILGYFIHMPNFCIHCLEITNSSVSKSVEQPTVNISKDTFERKRSSISFLLTRAKDKLLEKALFSGCFKNHKRRRV